MKLCDWQIPFVLSGECRERDLPVSSLSRVVHSGAGFCFTTIAFPIPVSRRLPNGVNATKVASVCARTCVAAEMRRELGIQPLFETRGDTGELEPDKATIGPSRQRQETEPHSRRNEAQATTDRYLCVIGSALDPSHSN